MEFMRDYLEKKVDEREITREQIRKIVNEKQEMENNYQQIQLQRQQQQQDNLDVEHDGQTDDMERADHHFQHHEQLQLQLQQQQHMHDLLQQGVSMEEEIQTNQTQQQHSELIDNHHEMRGVEPGYLARSKQQLEQNLLLPSAAEPLDIHTKDYYHQHYDHSQLDVHHPSMVEVTIDESPMAITTTETILSPTTKSAVSAAASTGTTLPVVPTPLYRNQNVRGGQVPLTGVGHQMRAVISRRHSHPETTAAGDDLEWNPFEMIMQVQTNGGNNDEEVVGEQEVDVSNNDGISIGPEV